MTGRRAVTVTVACLLALPVMAGGSVSRAQAPCTWEIGVMGALSGDFAYYGKPIRNAVQLAAAQANDAGDLACTLEVVAKDTQGDPNQAPPSARALVDRERVVACICGFFSGETLASGKIFESGGLLMASSGTYPGNARQGFRTYFRTVANDAHQARSLGRYLRSEVGPRRAVIVYDDWSNIRTAMQKIRRVLGWRVAEVMRQDPESSNYSGKVRRIKQARADLVVYAGFEASDLLIQLRERGVDTPFATTAGVEVPRFARAVRRNLRDSVVNAVASCGCNQPARIRRAAEFVQAYRARYSVDPKLLAGDNYDAANLAIEALRGMSANDAVADIRRAVVRHVDAAVKVQGVIKRYTWKDNGELMSGDRHTFIFKWREDDWRMRGSVYRLTRYGLDEAEG